jgi:hypothetical protein
LVNTGSVLHARLRGVAAALTVVSCLGCSGADRWELSGKVTHAGQPVKQGHISFDPIQPGKGGGFARIFDGQYDTREHGRTHSGGRHRVTISAYQGLKNPKNPDSDVVLQFPAYITEIDFPQEAATLDFDVPADWAQTAAANKR